VRALVYDTVILDLTTRFYAAVLRELPVGAHVLDVGIGTGGALARNADLVRERDLRVTGVDIHAAYLDRARRRLDDAGLSDRVSLVHASIHDFDGGPFGAAYFSASFMLIPEPAEALRHVRSLLIPGGKVYFTQTFHHRPAPMMEWLKPRLKRLTTIDFGTVTYEADFRRTIAEAGMQVERLEALTTGRGNSSGRLAVAV
jgi:ubiquinone/menaquinone biosynthesis C-methylase UbiE